MSEVTHTPGPWFVPIGCPEFIYSHPCGGYCVAEVHEGQLPEDEQRANARLIAAAPELLIERDALLAKNTGLLDALQNLVALLPDPELDTDPVQRAYVIAARAAITKAKEAR